MGENETYIADAINDADTGPWFKAVGSQGELWFSAAQYVKTPSAIQAEIVMKTGCLILNAGSKRQLEEEMGRAVRRAGKVVTQSGWCNGAFVCGDGGAVPARHAVDVIAFEPLPKFSRVGELKDWQDIVAPYIAGQCLPFFIVALSLAGPLLHFVQAEMLNPIVELVGEPKAGKSTLGVLAASVWAGDPHKTEGGGENWNMTPNVFDLRRDDHRDMLLLLDEAEGTGSDERSRQDIARLVIFTGATTSKKARMTDIKRSPLPLRLVLLSTANTSFREVLRNERHNRFEAAMSRILPISVSKETANGLPVFNKLPPGHKDMKSATSGLRRAVDRAYGAAGPAFAKYLAQMASSDEGAFKAGVCTTMDAVVQRLTLACPDADIRQCRTLAVVELAGYLAREAGVLPAEWGEPSRITDRVFRQIMSGSIAESALADSEIDRLEVYVERQLKQSKFRRLGDLIIPMPWICKVMPGFVAVDKRGKRELLVAPDYFDETFDQAWEFLHAARRDGRLKCYPSETDRLTAHAPRWMRKYGFTRVYRIWLR